MQGLRTTAGQMPGASFEDLLCEAEWAGNEPKRTPGAKARRLPQMLLQAPRVFVLVLVWESPQACPCSCSCSFFTRTA